MKARAFRWRVHWHMLVGLVLCAVSLGCATSTQSVRALRMHSREDARFETVSQRLQDLEKGINLSERLLESTPYTPGVGWVQALALQDTRASALEATLRTQGVYTDPTVRVPTSSVVYAHMESVLKRAESEPAHEAAYPSILDAFEAHVPGGTKVRSIFNSLRAKRSALADVSEEIRRLEDKQSSLDPKRQNSQWQALQREIRAKEKAHDVLEEEHETLETSLSTTLDTWTPERMQGDPNVLRDVLAVFSLVVRLDMESAALLPVVGMHLFRALPYLGPPSNNNVKMTPTRLAEIAQAIEFGGTFAHLSTTIPRRLDASLPISRALARLSSTDLETTAGFLWSESASEMVVGFALDSFYLDLNAGVEAYWFVIADSEVEGSGGKQATSDDPIVYDFTGRRQKLNYRIDPILLADFNAKLGFDFGGIADFFNLNFDYKTDRVYQSGGSVEYSDNALEEAGLSSSTFSDALGVGLSILGVNSSVRIARFNAGEVDIEQVSSGFVIATLPFQIDLTQVDLSYNLLWLMRDSRVGSMFDALNIGFRYQNYAVPRIVYEFEDQNGAEDLDQYTYVRESPVQVIENTVYMGGVSLKRGMVAGSGTGFILDLGLFLGAGPTKYAMTQNEEAKLRQLFAANVDFKLGWAFHFLDVSERFKIDFVALYEVQGIAVNPLSGEEAESSSDGARFTLHPAVGQSASEGESTSDLGDRNQSFGAVEILHGPKAHLKVSF